MATAHKVYTTPLAKKLGIVSAKSSLREVALLGAPAGLVAQLGELPETVKFTKKLAKGTELALCFTRSADEVRLQSRALVQYSPEHRKLNQELRDYLYTNLYFNPVVHQPNLRAVRMLEELFHHYVAHPKEVGERARKRFRKDGRHRAICDYLAGMTDRYAMQEHERVFGPTPPAGLKSETGTGSH